MLLRKPETKYHTSLKVVKLSRKFIKQFLNILMKHTISIYTVSDSRK